MAFLTQIYNLLKGSRHLIALSVGCGLLFAATNLLPPLLIRKLIKWLTEGGGTTYELLTVSVLLFGLYLFRGAARYWYGRFSHVAAYQVLHDLMTRVYRHLQGLPHRFFNNQRTGALISRSINDVEAVEDFVAHGIPETLLALVIPTSMIVVLFFINPKLALITLIPIPITAYLVYRFVSGVRRTWGSVREKLSELAAQVQDNLSGVTIIKSFVQERHSAKQIETRSGQFRDVMNQANTVSLLPMAIIEAGGGLGIVLVIWYGGSMALGGTISVADLFVFIVYLGYIYRPFLQLASINDNLQKAAASANRVFEILSIQSDIVDAPDAAMPDGLEWDIQFRNVTFGYDPEISVLHDIDFRVEEGEIVALVGSTGSGKTTIINLVSRFYDPQKGAILIGGHDIRKLPVADLRRNIAMVLQDVFLFHGTVRDNILFGRPDAGETEIIQAARAANAEEFILDLPSGYDTFVGERGVRLSGGEKQRLSIARALLKDAPILILDEATSSVDAGTESLIQEAVSNLARHRTSLVIAHRLSTIRNADRIIVLGNGRIVETGGHDQLMEKNGIYAGMFRAQDISRTWQIGQAD